MVITIVVFLILVIAIISTFWPRYEMQFIELGLLGKNRIADNYFSNENSTVFIDSQVDWNIFLHNHMENSQNVIVKVKLLNSTMDLPNDKEHKPSSIESFFELPFSLSNNETFFASFSWSINEVLIEDNLITLKNLKVNSQQVEVDVKTFSNSFFRMVFELWVYDKSSQSYEFSWNSGEDYSSASIYIGFRV
jgi:uncharacterized membrane protein